MTSGVKSGLKSWLTFGSSVAGSQGGMARSKSVAAVSESEMEADPIHSGIYEAFFGFLLVQLNKYETAPKFIQSIQNLTSDCLLI